MLDCGQVLAGPFAATLLGDFGAEVIKIEQPRKGDMLRSFAPPNYWAVDNRNKKSITLDLRQPKGQALFKRLVRWADILIENFRPGTLERWNLGYEELVRENPRLVLIRATGFGQTGPYRGRAAFDRIGLAMGGLTYVTGYPDAPPVRPGYFIADYLTGMMGAFAALMAVYARDRHYGRGQVVDISLFEAVWRISGTVAADFHAGGIVRERMGNELLDVVPADQCRTGDGKWLVYYAGPDHVFARLCEAMGRPELAQDPRYAKAASRLDHRAELLAIIREWVAGLSLAEAMGRLETNSVPATGVYSVADIFLDPHYEAREAIAYVQDPEVGEVAQPAVVPKLSGTPGAIFRPAPRLGEHNQEVFQGLLGLSDREILVLESEGVT